AESRLPVASLDEALAIPVEPFCGVLAGDPVGDVLRDNLGLAVREDTCLRKGFSKRQGDRDHIANRVDAGESCLEGVSIDGDPSALTNQTALAYDLRWTMGRHVRQQIE